jgi:hypothetical protein
MTTPYQTFEAALDAVREAQAIPDPMRDGLLRPRLHEALLALRRCTEAERTRGAAALQDAMRPTRPTSGRVEVLRYDGPSIEVPR